MKRIPLFLAFVFSMTLTSSAQLFAKKDKDRKEIPGVTGKLTLHPDSVAYKGTDGSLYFFFYDFSNKCLFISKTEGIYRKFADFLPEVIIPGRYISPEGPTIDPFTLFTRDQLKEEGQRLGIKLNKFKVVKIFNYGMYPGTSTLPSDPKNTGGPMDNLYKKNQ
jgi:hypothetical protein